MANFGKAMLFKMRCGFYVDERVSGYQDTGVKVFVRWVVRLRVVALAIYAFQLALAGRRLWNIPLESL
jgi:hypothetical protein